jgi:deoxyguanosine kinase
LNQQEYHKYLSIYNILTQDMPTPNVIVYLHASLETLLKRIEVRGREIEKSISPLYLKQLSLDYEEAMAHFEQEYPDVPVLRFNGDELDFVKNKRDLDYMISQLSEALTKRSVQP